MSNANPVGYRIQHVAEVTGIPRNTLISWERRHQLVTPMRAANGYRYYSQLDIDLLVRAKELLDLGHAIGDATRILARDEPPQRTVGGLEQVRDRLLEALLAFDVEEADRLRSEMAPTSFESAIDEVYRPLLIEVGERWARGQILVSQEHHAAAYCRAQMMGMLVQLGGGRRESPRAVCAGAPGELHEIGLLAVAVKLALRGFSVTYLGNEVPTGEITEVVRSTGATVVCLSIVGSRRRDELIGTLRQLRASLAPGVLLAIGGDGAGCLELEPGLEGIAVCGSVDDLVAAIRRL